MTNTCMHHMLFLEPAHSQRNEDPEPGHLMSDDSEEVDPEPRYVHRHLAHCLGRVGVEPEPLSVGTLSQHPAGHRNTS